MGQSILINLGMLIFVIVLNALFVAAEYSLIRIRRTRVEEMVREGTAGAATIQYLQHNLDRSVAGAQLGVTVASLVVGWVGESAIEEGLTFCLNLVPFVGPVTLPHGVAIAFSFLVMSILHVVLGEQVPKFIAIRFTEATLRRLAAAFALFCTIVSPLIWVMNKVARIFLFPFGVADREHNEGGVQSTAELRLIVDESKEYGVLDAGEHELVQAVLEMGDVLVREVMIPRVSMVSITDVYTLEEIIEVITETKHSKLPVFDEDGVNILGVLNMTDLIDVWKQSLSGKQPDKPFAVRDIVREAFFVLDTLKADHVLQEMKENHVKMAIVVDEYGTTVGEVTLEDLLEELVGELYDEYDVSTADIVELGEGTHKVRGNITLAEFNEHFECHILSEESSTVAGAFIEALGKQPDVGEELTIHGFYFKVLEKDNQAISWFEVRRV